MVAKALGNPGFRGVCIREVQKDLKDSAKKLITDKISAHGLGDRFDVQVAEIKTPGGGVIIFQGMQDHTAESIKSLEGFDVAWVEEAHSLSQRSLTLLRPTIRNDDSELWFSWNPTRKNDPVDHMFRGNGKIEPGVEWTRPTDAIVVEANWVHNPWFPAVLVQERLDDLRLRPDQYEHIWDGGYSKVTEGAYFAADLLKAKAENRIGNVTRDPLMTVRAIWDIGGTGAKADACSIWIAQFVGREIRVLDYYEAQGQPLATHINWLREKGYGKALCVLPHDGSTNDRVHDVSFESALKQAGFEVQVIANQGKGAAKARIEAARRRFPMIWFNATTTEGGREALGAYHEKRDEGRNIGLGPEHDWSSHGADAFGLMCVAYEEPQQGKSGVDPLAALRNRGSGSWMGK
jgi:phage terminase large subunit